MEKCKILKHDLNIYEMATEFTDKSIQVTASLLLHCIRPKVRKVCN